jgi:SynChlorMet cassette radical SAM/SPASM protein ScmF
MTVCDTVCDTVEETQAESAPLDLPEGVPALTSFYLYLTNGCNLRCRHCWITPKFVNGEPDPGDCLDPELLRKAVREAKPLGLSAAKLTGGEPVLHPQFVEIVDLLTDEGLALTMETNGTLIDADLARHLKDESNLNFVSVSLDGPNAEVHDAFRGVPGSFDAAVRGLRHLVDVGFAPQVIMSLHRDNVQSIEDMVALAVDMGAGSIKFNPVMPSGRGMKMYESNDTLSAVDVLGWAHSIRGKLQDRTSIQLILSTPLALYTLSELWKMRPASACRVRNILGILGDGETALCGIGRNIPALCFGNLRDNSIRNIWLNTETLIKLRQDLDHGYTGICKDCIHARKCLTWCVAQNYLDNGALVSPSWLCAELFNQGQFPGSRLRQQE